MVNPGDANRLFLQAFLSRRVVSLKVLKKLHQKTNDIVRGWFIILRLLQATNKFEIILEVDPKVPLEDSFEVFYENIRSMISRLDAGLEIQIMTDEITGEPVHALVRVKVSIIVPLTYVYYRLTLEMTKSLNSRRSTPLWKYRSSSNW